VRVSKERDGMTSPDVQEHAIQTLANQHGIEITGWVYGIDESGSREKSAWWPRLDQSIARMEAGEIDTILVWKFSRIGRARLKWAIALDKVDSLGGTIMSATEPIETVTASGRFARGMLGELNAYQADLIGETWREAHMRRRRLGLTAEGGPRFGYIKQPDGSYVPHPEEAQLLAQMYRRYLAGDGFTKIVTWLNRSGHQTRSGREWGRVVLTHLLDSGFGAGQIIHRPMGKDGKRDWRMSHAKFYPGAHSPVITADEWTDYVARRLDVPAPSRAVAGKYMLTGMIFCGDCGAPMHVGNQGLKDYKCSRAAQYRDVPGMYMTRALVERRVREWVGEMAGDVEELARIAARQRERKVVQLDNVQTLDRRITEIKDQLGRVTVRWSAGRMSDEAYDAAAGQIEAELESLKARRRAAAPRAKIEVDPTKLLMDLDRDWEDMLVGERRKVLLALIRSVNIDRPLRQGTGVWRERVRITPTWAPDVG
jgi:site-specific DNA recombinase